MPDDFESNFNDGLHFLQDKQYDQAILKFKDASSFNQNSSEIHYYLGLSYLQKELYNDAITELKKSISINPQDPDVQSCLLLAFLHIGNSEEYLKELKNALKSDAINNPTIRQLAEATFSSDEHVDEGIILFRDLITKNPNNKYYCSVLASFLELKGRLEDSLLVLKKLTNLDPLNSGNYVKIGILLKKIGRIDEALQLVEAAILTFPDDVALKNEYQNLLLEKIVKSCEKKEWKEAIRLFHLVFESISEKKEEITISPVLKLSRLFGDKNRDIIALYFFLEVYPQYPNNWDLLSVTRDFLNRFKVSFHVIDDYISSIGNGDETAIIHYHLAESLEYEHDLEEIVVAEYRKAIKLDPEYGYYNLRLGEFLINISELEGFKEFKEWVKKDPTNKKFANDYFWYAVLLLRHEDDSIDESIYYFHKGLEYEPELFYFWFDELLGYLLCADLFEKAEVCFKKFIATFEKEIGSGYALEKIAESYSCAHQGLGQIYQFKGQIDKAIMEYKKAIAIFPKGAYNHIILGEFFLKLNRINETISEYKKAIECDPGFAQYHKSLGDILLKNEDFIDALEAYRKAHEIWPDEKNFTKAYFDLKNSLDKSLYRKISDQHLMRGIDQQNVRIDTSHLPDLNNQIELTELRLRKIISDSLDNDPSKLPPNIFQNLTDFIQREVKKNAVLDFRNYKSLSAMLEFSDIRDLQNIIIGKTNWPIFEMRFGNKERLNTKFDQFAELRNRIRHSRPVDKITHKEGEAAILWFEQVLNK